MSERHTTEAVNESWAGRTVPSTNSPSRMRCFSGLGYFIQDGNLSARYNALRSRLKAEMKASFSRGRPTDMRMKPSMSKAWRT